MRRGRGQGGAVCDEAAEGARGSRTGGASLLDSGGVGGWATRAGDGEGRRAAANFRRWEICAAARLTPPECRESSGLTSYPCIYPKLSTHRSEYLSLCIYPSIWIYLTISRDRLLPGVPRRRGPPAPSAGRPAEMPPPAGPTLSPPAAQAMRAPTPACHSAPSGRPSEPLPAAAGPSASPAGPVWPGIPRIAPPPRALRFTAPCRRDSL